MASLAKLRVDKKKVNEGIPVAFIPGITLRIAKLPNPQYEDALMRYSRSSKVAMRVSGDTKLMQEAVRHAVAKAVLLGWEGLTETDKPDSPAIPYSPEKALEIFEEYPDLYSFVLQIANDPENFRLEEDKGNS